jgi:hypothetical protein
MRDAEPTWQVHDGVLRCGTCLTSPALLGTLMPAFIMRMPVGPTMELPALARRQDDRNGEFAGMRIGLIERSGRGFAYRRH